MDAEICIFTSTQFLGDDNTSGSADGMTVILERKG